MNINEVLDTNPSLKARKAEETEQARLKWLQAKEELKRLEAKTALIIKAEKPSIIATLLKFRVDEDESIHKGRIQLTILESEYRLKEIMVNFYDDEFTAAKVLARLKMSEMRTIEGGIQ